MLAYVFWHRPSAGVDRDAYEQAQRAFHSSLDRTSACFRVDRLPFEPGGGYEDWYLVEDWRDLGVLNEEAVDRVRRKAHDLAAAMSAEGWGGVYRLIIGTPAIPDGARWQPKPPAGAEPKSTEAFAEGPVWQRQLVLGPAPELCVAAPDSPERQRVWP